MEQAEAQSPIRDHSQRFLTTICKRKCNLSVRRTTWDRANHSPHSTRELHRTFSNVRAQRHVVMRASRDPTLAPGATRGYPGSPGGLTELDTHQSAGLAQVQRGGCTWYAATQPWVPSHSPLPQADCAGAISNPTRTEGCQDQAASAGGPRVIPASEGTAEIFGRPLAKFSRGPPYAFPAI